MTTSRMDNDDLRRDPPQSLRGCSAKANAILAGDCPLPAPSKMWRDAARRCGRGAWLKVVGELSLAAVLLDWRRPVVDLESEGQPGLDPGPRSRTSICHKTGPAAGLVLSGALIAGAPEPYSIDALGRFARASAPGVPDHRLTLPRISDRQQ